MQESIKPILFIEFFERKYMFDKHEILPKNFFDNVYKHSLGRVVPNIVSCIGLENDVLYLLPSLSDEVKNNILESRASIVVSVTTEYYANNTWINRRCSVNCYCEPNIADREKFSTTGLSNFRSCAPHGFDIIEADENGTILFTFPDRYTDKMKTGERYSFFFKKMPREDMEYYSPGMLLCMIVKNNGLVDRVVFTDDSKLQCLNAEHLLLGKMKQRDFRKSALLYELS